MEIPSKVDNNNNIVITAGGPPPIWRKATYITLAILSFLYLSITIILFYTRRKKIADIRFRPLRLNILNVIATIILCVMFCLRTAFYPYQYPCVLMHWPAYIGFFLYCTALSCRVLSFSWVAKYNLAKLRISVSYNPSNPSNNGSNNGSNNDPTSPLSPTRERMECPSNKCMNRLKKLKHFTTDKWLTYWILCPVMAIAFLFALVAQILSPELSISPLNTDCRIGPASIPLFLMIGVFLLIICPILIYLLYDIRDAYGLRNELLVKLTSGLFSYTGYFIIELVLPRWKNYFGSLMFSWVSFLICHTISITVPVIRSYSYRTYSVPNSKLSARGVIKRTFSVKKNNQNKNNNNGDGKSKRYRMFEKVLEDPELFESYKICAAACFCTELIIFLQEYQFLKMLVVHCCTPTNNKEMLPPPSPRLHITETGHISFPEKDLLYSSPAPLVSPSFITTPCTKSIVETVTAASWIPFPHELIIDYSVFYETFFDSDSDLTINFPGNLLNDVKNMVESGKYELTMYEHAREEVLNLLYRNTFERFLKVCGSEVTKKGLSKIGD